MRPIEINLSAQPYRNDLPLAGALLALAVIAFGVTGWESFAYFTAGSRRAELQNELQGHGQRMERMKREAEKLSALLAKVDEKELRSQAEFVDGILAERNFSWTRLFNALEDVIPWSTRLTSVRPVIEKGTISVELEGVSRDMDAFLDVQSTLLRSDRFSNIVPGDYQRLEGDQRISFHLRATYKPEVPTPDRKKDATETAAANEPAAETAPPQPAPTPMPAPALARPPRPGQRMQPAASAQNEPPPAPPPRNDDVPVGAWHAPGSNDAPVGNQVQSRSPSEMRPQDQNAPAPIPPPGLGRARLPAPRMRGDRPEAPPQPSTSPAQEEERR